MSKEAFAYKNKTTPEYVIGKPGKWKLLYRNWSKDPIANPNIDTTNINFDLYMPYIINKYDWNNMSVDIIIMLLQQHLKLDQERVKNYLEAPDLYTRKVEVFRKVYENRKKLKLKPSKLTMSKFIPTQIKHSFVIKADISVLIYHFDNIVLGDFFEYALFNNYVKISPLFTYNANLEATKNFILLSTSITKFYISSCDKGLVIEFYDMSDLKDVLIKKVRDALQLTGNKISHINTQYTQGRYVIKNQSINKDIFAYLVLIDQLYSTYLTMPETTLSHANNRFFFKFLSIDFSKSKSLKYTSYLDLLNKKTNFGEITASYKNIFSGLEIYISRSLGKTSINQFQNRFNSLLDYYNKKKNPIIEIYTNFGFERNKFAITKGKITGKLSLKKLYPGIFPSKGYATNCPPARQPAIIKDIEEIKKYNPGKILKFPASEKDKLLILQNKLPDLTPFTDKFGVQSQWFVCDKKNLEGKIPINNPSHRIRGKINKGFPFPGLGKTPTPQTYSKVPCCFVKPQTRDKKLKVKQNISHLKGASLCPGNSVCELPELLRLIFNMLDPTYRYYRQGATSDILTSLNIICDKKIKFKDIVNFKNLGITKQENWDIQDIKGYLQDGKFIDPRRFIMLLEKVYKRKIFIFERKMRVSRSVIKEREIPMLLIPYHNPNTNYYTFNTHQQAVILFSHYGTDIDNTSLPHYEIIFQIDKRDKQKYSFTHTDRITRSLYKLFNMVNESFCLTREIISLKPVDFPHATLQILDYYGKCRGVIIKNVNILFDPMPPINKPYIMLDKIIHPSEKNVGKILSSLNITYKKVYNAFTGHWKGLEIRIPFKSPEKSTPTFRQNRLVAKYLVATTFYLFSKNLTKLGKSPLQSFQKNYIIIEPKHNYDIENMGHMGHKLFVTSKKMKNRLIFLLYQKYTQNTEFIINYHTHKIFPNFYNEIRDFKQYENQTILTLNNLKDYIYNLMPFYRRYSPLTIPSDIHPHFVIDKKRLYIYQRCQDENTQHQIEKIWKDKHYNKVDLVEYSDQKNIAKLEF